MAGRWGSSWANKKKGSVRNARRAVRRLREQAMIGQWSFDGVMLGLWSAGAGPVAEGRDGILRRCL